MSHDVATPSPYRRVSISTWADQRVRNLTPLQPSGQALFLLLMVGPQTTSMPGVQPVGRMAFAEMLGWGVEAFDEAFAEAYREGLVLADWEARFVFVPKAIQHNPPQSVNVVKSWWATWSRVPECDLKTQAWHVIYAALEGIGKNFAETFKSVCPLRNPDVDEKAKIKASDKSSVKPKRKPTGKASGKPTEKTTGIQVTGNRKQEQDKNIGAFAPVADAPGVGQGSGAPPDQPERPPKPPGLAELLAEGVDEQHALDWLKVRKAKRAGSLTKTVMAALRREALKAGVTVAVAVQVSAERGWQGFNAAWLHAGVLPAAKLPRPENFADRNYGSGGKL